MSLSDLAYILKGNGKNAKLPYYARAYARMLVPAAICRARLPRLLAEIDRRPDAEEIYARADYYCRLDPGVPVALPADAPTIADLAHGHHGVYNLDTMEYARYFSPQLHLCLRGGDNILVPEVPSLVKSRPIREDASNARAVVLKLNKVRHFIFVDDPIPFEAKDPRALFRGKARLKPLRLRFMERWHGHPRVCAATIDAPVAAWQDRKFTIAEQLRFRYIMAIEGNDVASNLKWVMSSDSLAVTPPMNYETWFMEGTLEAGRHYIEVRPDFSDLEEKMDYYDSHPAEAREIIREAHAYVDRFRDGRRERLISLLVLHRYFAATGQI